MNMHGALPKRNQFYIGEKQEEKNIPNVTTLSPHFINEPISEDIDMNNHRIINIKIENNNDVINKNYVDSALSSKVEKEYVDSNFVFMSYANTNFYKKNEEIDLNNHKIVNVKDPENNQDAVSKKYLNDITNFKITEKIENIFTKNINMNGNKITVSETPINKFADVNKKIC